MGHQCGKDTIFEATLSLSIMGNGRNTFCAALVKRGWLFIIINMYLLARNNMKHVIRYNICAAGFVFRQYFFSSAEEKISKKERSGLKPEYYVFIYTISTTDLKLIRV